MKNLARPSKFPQKGSVKTKTLFGRFGQFLLQLFALRIRKPAEYNHAKPETE